MISLAPVCGIPSGDTQNTRDLGLGARELGGSQKAGIRKSLWHRQLFSLPSLFQRKKPWEQGYIPHILRFELLCKCFGDFWVYLGINIFFQRISEICENRKFWRFDVVLNQNLKSKMIHKQTKQLLTNLGCPSRPLNCLVVCMQLKRRDSHRKWPHRHVRQTIILRYYNFIFLLRVPPP